MVGPRYRKGLGEYGALGHEKEYLSYTCSWCGYEERRPCRDSWNEAYSAEMKKMLIEKRKI